jgi:hypothetical protein
MMVELEQIAFPVSVVDGAVATVGQASAEFTLAQVEVLCLTPLGWVPGAPEMGLADQRFRRGGPDTGEIERQIADWVPEAKEAVDHDSAALDRGLGLIGVRVSR